MNNCGFAECIKMEICRNPEVNPSRGLKIHYLITWGPNCVFLKSSKTLNTGYTWLAGLFGWLLMIDKSEMMLNQVCLVNKSNNAAYSKWNKLNLVKNKRLLSNRIFSNTSKKF